MSEARPDSDHVARNRAAWDAQAADHVATGERNWAAGEPTWGIWDVPESELRLLPPADELAGADVIELGCGTGYVSGWLAHAGARPVAIDNSEAQLETARRLQRKHGIEFPLIHGNAERVPRPDASFDLAISEYGASIWCDPYLWIPEAARLLRPGGRLIILVGSVLQMLCSPDEPEEPVESRLLRSQFGLHRIEWPDDGSVEFHLPHGELIALLRREGFEIEGLTEVRPPTDATTRYEWMTLEWARRWPCEEVWKARKRSD